MKKTLSILCAAMCVFALVSCQKSGGDEAETTAAQTNAQTTAETTADAAEYDFSEAKVYPSSCALMSCGDEKTIFASSSVEDAEFYSSNGSVASVGGDGVVTAVAEGTALIVADTDGDDICYAVCVLPEGKRGDPSALSTVAYECGTSASLPPEMLNASVSSDDESIVKPSGTKLEFLSPGYTVVTAASASVPHIYGYIVFERTAK